MTKRELIKVASVAQTCFACPAQWQGETEDGQEIYVRYRWGWLEVHLGGVLTEPILDLQLGGEWHVAWGNDFRGLKETHQRDHFLARKMSLIPGREGRRR